ncbi:MAG: protease-4 [Alteromonadaceae bacterium]|jgi:protease-4
MNPKASIVKRTFNKIFQILNISRKVLINLIFFTLLLIFISALMTDTNHVVVPEESVLVLDLYGDIVEQKRQIEPLDAFMSEAIQQNNEKPEILLSDITNVIKSAETDDRIKVLVLKLQNMNSSGLTKMRDIAKAIEHFKTSGKQVIAIGDQYSQDQYYLASYADEIWLDPKGWMILDGYGRYQLYYKSALDKLSISQHIFRVGTYKSAVEPYMRDDMSAAAKEANKVWLNDLWSQYKADVAEQRGFSVDNFDENVDNLVEKVTAVDGNIAEYALTNQWVDHLKTREQINQTLNEMLAISSSESQPHESNNDSKYESINFNDYLFAITDKFPMVDTTSDKVAIVIAKGTILNGTQKPGSIGGDSTALLLKQARNNKNVKAVVLRVDSPGGSAYASEIIRQEVELLKQAGKPVIASMGTYAASGGYWISAPADKIIAAPTTITGSIGIFGLFMTFEKTLDKFGIHTDGVGTTDLAGFGVTRPLSDGMGKIIQMNINRGYKDFIALVAHNRNMTTEQVDAIAQGRVWSGIKAKEIGLVDELGDLNDAIVAAADMAKLEVYDTLIIEKELSSRDKFIKNLLGQASALLPSSPVTSIGPIDGFIGKLKAELNHLNQLNDPQGVYTLCMACELN